MMKKYKSFHSLACSARPVKAVWVERLVEHIRKKARSRRA